MTEAVGEMEAALADASVFLTELETAERTRLCERPGKNGTGRKMDTPTQAAKPWHGAADHDVHLAHWLIKLRTAMRLAAMQRGSFSVRPMEGTDAKRAQALRLVMLYYLQGAMGSTMAVQGSRAGAWADRYGHSVLQVGWKRELAVERRQITRAELVRAAMERNLQEAAALGEPLTPDSQEIIAQATELDF